VKGDKKRPSGSEKRQRTELAMVRLTPAEKTAVEDAADKAGLSVASYSRLQMLGAPPPRGARRPPVEKQMLAKVLGQLGKIGSNLNQVARSANMGEDDLAETRQALSEVRLATLAVLAALGRGQ
jgi:hypothetical protein